MVIGYGKYVVLIAGCLVWLGLVVAGTTESQVAQVQPEVKGARDVASPVILEDNPQLLQTTSENETYNKPPLVQLPEPTDTAPVEPVQSVQVPQPQPEPTIEPEVAPEPEAQTEPETTPPQNPTPEQTGPLPEPDVDEVVEDPYGSGGWSPGIECALSPEDNPLCI